jgi:hypothetical protein
MLNVGDVNGDSHEDVATANSNNSTGSILLGDGNGNLAVAVTTSTDSFTLATDLGDIDGDGDLDWATSSYAGDWNLFLNDGLGNFTFYRAFPPTEAASCALMLDMDNNGTLDLALIDEIADEVQLLHNPLSVVVVTPTISVTPPSISSTLLIGTAVTHTLTISNLGTAVLEWDIHESACTAPANVPWLTAAPISGTTTISATTAVTVSLNAFSLLPGNYAANVCIASNDPANPEVNVPISLTVAEKGMMWWIYVPVVVRP